MFESRISVEATENLPRSVDIISRLPGCDGQSTDAVSAYSQVKMEDAHKLLKKIQNRSVQTFGFVNHDTNGIMGQAIRENPTAERVGEGFLLGMLIRTP